MVSKERFKNDRIQKSVMTVKRKGRSKANIKSTEGIKDNNFLNTQQFHIYLPEMIMKNIKHDKQLYILRSISLYYAVLQVRGS